MAPLLQRLKWVGAFLLVFLLILATNLLDRRHFREMGNTVRTIYEDRLVAKELIFKIDRQMHRKIVRLAAGEFADVRPETLQVENDSLNHFIQQFEQTELTQDEARLFQKMKKRVSRIGMAEKKAGNDPIGEELDELERYYLRIQDDLDGLSRIQLKEGQRRLASANRAMESVEFFTKIEIIALIIIGLLLQLFLLYPVKWNKV